MATKTSIIFTVTNDLTYDQRMQRICTSLANNGYKVTLVGRLKRSSPVLTEQSFYQKRLYCYFQKGKLFYLEFNLRLLIYLLRHSRVDGLGPVDLDTIVPCYLATKWKKIPCIHDAHEYFAEVPEVVNRPWVKKVWEQVAKKTIPRMDLCYTVSESLAEILQKKYGSAFHVIRNVPWLQQKPKRVTPIDSNRFILYQGALNEGRGLETLIEAMEDIELHLYIAGEGDLSQTLREHVNEKGLQNKVYFLGYLAPEALKKLTPKAFLGFNVLENKGLNYYYSLPNKFFDYLHAGVPVLTNDFPEYRKINNQYQVALLMNLSKQAIIDAVTDLQNKQDFYQQLVNNCLRARKAFNWDQEEKHLVTLYQDVFSLR